MYKKLRNWKDRITESNLGIGRVATSDGRPTDSRREQSFNRIFQVAPIAV